MTNPTSVIDAFWEATTQKRIARVREYITRIERVEAVKLPDSASKEELEYIARWVGGAVEVPLSADPMQVRIPSLDCPELSARPGEWIVRGYDGKFLVMGNEEFNAKFQPREGKR